MADLGDMLARLMLDSKQWVSGLKDAEGAAESSSQKIGGAFGGIDAAIGGIMDAVAGLAALGGLTAFGQSALEAAEKTEKLEAAFNQLNGATEETAKVFNDISGLEMKSMFDFEDTLGPAAKSMMMLGVSAEQTAETMTAVVDAAAAMKQGPEYINAVTGTIANMQSHLVATGKDMKALQAQGIDAWGALARNMGVSMQEAQEAVKKGLISSQQVTAAVTDEMGKRFAGAAERSMDSWKGAMHVLDETTEDAMVGIGEVIKDLLTDITPAIKAVSAAIKEFAEWWKSLDGPMKEAIVVFTGVTTAVIGLAAAWKAMQAAMALMTLNPWIVSIGLLVSALVLLGKWVYDNWPAIQAVLEHAWEGIQKAWTVFTGWIKTFVVDTWEYLKNKLAFLAPMVDGLKDIWGDLVALWTGAWKLLKNVFTSTFDGILAGMAKVGNLFSSFLTWIGNVAGKIPGAKEMADSLGGLGKVWDEQQAKMAAATKATEEKKKADEEAATAATQTARASQQADAAALAAANRAKEAAAEHKKAAEEAKKAAEEQRRYAEGVRKGYEELAKVAPDVADQFANAMGGLREDSSKFAQVFGAVWEKIPASVKAVITEVGKLAEAFDKLGMKSTQGGLENAAKEADAAYQKIRDSGKATAADLNAAMAGVLEAHKKHTDFLNADVKKAYDEGKMSASEYYNTILDRAQTAYDKTEELFAKGQASEQQRFAARVQLANATKALSQNTAKDIAAAYDALGEKGKQQLDKSTADWAKYYATLKRTAGEGSREAAEAQLKVYEDMRASLRKSGKDFTDEQLKEFEAVKAKVKTLQEPIRDVTQAFKALGVTPLKSLQDELAKLTQALIVMQNATGESAPAFEDLYAAQKKVDEITQQIIDRMSQKWKDAHERGEITATEMYQNIVAEAEKYLESVLAVGEYGPEELAKIEAALNSLAVATKKAADSTKKDLEAAYHSVGLKTVEELEKQIAAVEDAQGKIVSGSKAGIDAQLKLQIEHLKIEKQLAEQNAGVWTDAQEKMLRDLERQLERSTKKQKDVWGDLWKDIQNTARKFKNDVIDTIFMRLFEDPNKELKKQEQELRDSLATRAKEWDDYVAKNAGQLELATANYEAAMRKQEQDTRDALAEAASDYEDYAREVTKNIEDIREKHAREMADEIGDASDALAEREQDYAEYAAEVADHLDEIHEKYADQLADEEEQLRDSLADRAQEYEDFVEDTNTALSRLGQDTAQNIADETEDTQQNIDERTKDYNRYAEDTQKKIAQVREKNKGVYTAEEADLLTSLARKKEDLDDYIQEQNRKLERYTRDQQQRQEREIADHKETLDRKTRDYEEWQKETLEKHDERVEAIKKSENAEVENAQEGLRKKKEALDEFAIETAKKTEEIRQNHEAEQNAEVAKQEESLAKKKTAYDTHVADILAKNDEAVAGLKADYEQTTTDLKTELGNQKTEYDKFVTDITGPDGKLEQLKEKHRTIWGDIKTLATGAIEEIGKSILHLASDEILGNVVKGFLGEKGFGGMFSKIGGFFGGLLGGGGGGEGPNEGSGEGGGGGGLFGNLAGGLLSKIKIPGLGGAGSMMGKLFGATSAFNPIMAGLQVGGDILNFIGTMRTEGTMNQVERNTAAASIHLQHILEDGVNGWLPYLSTIAGFLWEVFAPAFATQMTTTETIRDSLKSGGDLANALKDINDAVESIKTPTDTIRDSLPEDAVEGIKTPTDSLSEMHDWARDNHARLYEIAVSVGRLSQADAAPKAMPADAPAAMAAPAVAPAAPAAPAPQVTVPELIVDLAGWKAQFEQLWAAIVDSAAAALGQVAKSVLYVAGDEVLGKLVGMLGQAAGALEGLFRAAAASPVPAPAGETGEAAPAAPGSELEDAIAAIGTDVGTIRESVAAFTTAPIEKTLDAIEESARLTRMTAAEQVAGLERMYAAGEDFNGITTAYYLDSLARIDAVIDRLEGMDAPLADIRDAIVFLGGPIVSIRDTVWELRAQGTSNQALLEQIASAMGAAKQPASITVNVSPQGLTTREAAQTLGNQIASNLSTQMVAVA